jgi:hypothetical protein
MRLTTLTMLICLMILSLTSFGLTQTKTMNVTAMTVRVPTATASPTQTLAKAIARAEGFYVKNSIPNRLHNPGDIRSHSLHAYPGQIGLSHGYVVFRNNRAGWNALEHQITKMVEGGSRLYSVNMTLNQFSKKYAESPTWVKNVSSILNVTSSTRMWEILDVAPILDILGEI